MRTTILEDKHNEKNPTKFSLHKIVLEHGALVTIGSPRAGATPTIPVGSGTEYFHKISRKHGLIIYNPDDDSYSFRDFSHNGTILERPLQDGQTRKIEIKNTTENLQDGDKLYFAHYGPVVFRQNEEVINNKDGSKTRTFREGEFD